MTERGTTSGKMSWGNIKKYFNRFNHRLVAASDSHDDYKNVADYVCDGTADDEQIQDAIDEIEAVSGDHGGVIGLAPGKFNVAAQVNVRGHGMHIAGLGGRRNRNSAAASQLGGGTVLLAAPGLAGAILDFRLAGDTAQLNGCSIRNLTIDGNANIGTAVDGLFWNVWRGVISEVDIYEMSGNGLHVREFANGIGDNRIFSCQFGYSTLAGILFDTFGADNHIVGVICNNNQDGVRIKAASEQFVSLHTFDNSRYGIWFDGAGSRTKITNWKCENSGQHGLFIDGSSGSAPVDVQVSGANFKGNSASADNTYAHIAVLGGGVGNIFRGTFTNLAFGSIGTVNPAYCIQLDARAEDMTFDNFSIQSTAWETADILDSGKRNVFNGWSKNAGNPASAGNWNGVNGRQGIMVRDTTNSLNYVWINGAWVGI